MRADEVLMNINVTREQRAEIQKRAAAENLDVRSYALRRLLGIHVEPRKPGPKPKHRSAAAEQEKIPMT